MNPNLILVSKQAMSWTSSMFIRKNLLTAYSQVYPRQCFKEYDPLGPNDNVIKGYHKKLIFVESSPHPLCILQKISQWRQIEEICFHVYGDFTAYTPEWRQAFDLLKEKKVLILTGSPAQKGLVSAFLKENSKAVVKVCPFPIKVKMKEQDVLKKRASARRKYRLDKKDFAILYAGRISSEKNVMELLEHLEPYADKNVKIFIAGSFDDLGYLFLGRNFIPGEYFHLWNQWWEGRPEKFKKKVRFLGGQNSQKLAELYCASDLFVSLSTYHDEDFGLAPLEALCHGCPVLLSTWGGYKGFAIDARSVKLTTPYTFKKDFEYFLNGKPKLSERQNRMKLFRKRFSIEVTKNKILELHHQRFHRFSQYNNLLKRHTQKILAWRYLGSPVYSSYSNKDKDYSKIYKSYYSE